MKGMRAIRWDLIVWILLGITAVLATGEWLTFVRIKERLYAEFDRRLVDRAISLTSLIEQSGDELEIDWLERGGEPPGAVKGVDYYQLWVKDGRSLLASKDLEGNDLPRFGAPAPSPAIREVSLPGGRPGRCVGLIFKAQLDADLAGDDENDLNALGNQGGDEVPAAQGAWLQLAVAKVDSVAPTLAGIKRLLFAVWIGCTLLSAVIVWFVVRRTLQPLEHLRSQIGSLQDTVAGQRIHLENPPAELQPVSDEINHLLARVEGALHRERNLTSNVAHELRTPISGLLSTLEVTLSRNREALEYRESSEECFEIAKRMHWLVNNLLSITRIEAGNVQIQNDMVDLEVSLREWWAPFAARAIERRLKVKWDIEPGARVETDPEFLRVVATNLYDNAVSYTPPGGTIEIRARDNGHIAVGNDAVDVSEGLIEHAFDPLWRHTEAREHVGAHAGLGLNLCLKIVSLLGGRIQARVRESLDWFEVQVEWA